MKKLGIIGFGNMGSAIIEGFVKNNFIDESKVYIYSKNLTENNCSNKYNIETCSNSVVKNCDYIILAVKPQNMDEVLLELSNVSENKIFISIAAGITKEYIYEKLHKSAKVVCVMPNILLKIGQGATVIEESEYLSKKNIDFIVSMFSSIGMVKIVPKGKLNYIIPISGSSPAFIYYIAKAFEAFSKDNGINLKDSKDLFCQTLIGSAKIMMQSEQNLDELISKVTSKGGTTIKGIETLEKYDVLNIFYKSLDNCTKRAFELCN